MKSTRFILCCAMLVVGIDGLAQHFEEKMQPINIKVELKRDSAWWNPEEDQTARLAKERREHPDPSEGRGGWYVTISYENTPEWCIDGVTSISFWREKDPMNPIYPVIDKDSVQDKDLIVGLEHITIDWNNMTPIDIPTDKKGRITTAFDTAKNPEDVGNLVKRHPTWKPIEFFVPYGFFHFSQIEGFDYSRPQKVAVYIMAQAGDNNYNLLGRNKKIPYFIYYWEPPDHANTEDLGTEEFGNLFDESNDATLPPPPPRPEPRPEPRPDDEVVPVVWKFVPIRGGVGVIRRPADPRWPEHRGGGERHQSCWPHKWVNLSVDYTNVKEVYAYTDGEKLPKKQQIVYGNDTLTFRKIKSPCGNNIYMSDDFVADSIATKEDAEAFAAQLNHYSDSLHTQCSFRLPIQNEVDVADEMLEVVGDEAYESYFQPDRVLLVMEDRRKLAPPTKNVRAVYATKRTERQCTNCHKKQTWSVRLIFADQEHFTRYKNKTTQHSLH